MERILVCHLCWNWDREGEDAGARGASLLVSMVSSVLTGITSAVLGRNSRRVGGHAFWKVINIPPITASVAPGVCARARAQCARAIWSAGRTYYWTWCWVSIYTHGNGAGSSTLSSALVYRTSFLCRVFHLYTTDLWLLWGLILTYGGVFSEHRPPKHRRLHFWSKFSWNKQEKCGYTDP